MDTLTSDLELLENLSKKISDLIYNNELSKIPYIDSQRRELIKKIKDSEIHRNDIKRRIGKIIKNNSVSVRATEKKLQFLSKNHHKYYKRLEAYYSNR